MSLIILPSLTVTACSSVCGDTWVICSSVCLCFVSESVLLSVSTSIVFVPMPNLSTLLLL